MKTLQSLEVAAPLVPHHLTTSEVLLALTHTHAIWEGVFFCCNPLFNEKPDTASKQKVFVIPKNNIGFHWILKVVVFVTHKVNTYYKSLY